MRHNRAAWEARAKGFTFPENGVAISYWDYCKGVYDGRLLISLGLGISTLEEYLDYCELQDIVIVGSDWVEELDTDKMTTNDRSWRLGFSPHIRKSSRPATNHQGYFGTNLARRLLGHRYKWDRNWVYGPNGTHGTKAMAYVIHRRFINIMRRVGLAFNCTDDLACCPLPIPACAAHEVVWNSAGVHDATYTRTL